jgi:membrane fusion protein (multidrug efflux system)
MSTASNRPATSLTFRTSSAFSHSLRSIETDGFGRWSVGLLITIVFLVAWVGWFFTARIVVYSVTDRARLEVAGAVHPVGAPVSGRVISVHMAVGRQVRAGDVLVELEGDMARLQLAEERFRRKSLISQPDQLSRELAAETQSLDEQRQAAERTIEESRARYAEADATALFAEQQLERNKRLNESGLVSQADLNRATADAQQRRAAAQALNLAVARLQQDQQSKISQQVARIERLNREMNSLRGSIETEAATVERLEQETERRRIRAPVDGRLGEIADLRVGSFISEGDKVATVVPAGELRIIADFLPAAALGRVRAGQSARLRLDGFPWTQFGSISATVASVASEARDARVRVELIVHPDPSSPIPLQHGLPGTVEVEVERVSPAELVLRAAGKRFGATSGS